VGEVGWAVKTIDTAEVKARECEKLSQGTLDLDDI
jgi:hypothetical protein